MKQKDAVLYKKHVHQRQGTYIPYSADKNSIPVSIVVLSTNNSSSAIAVTPSSSFWFPGRVIQQRQIATETHQLQPKTTYWHDASTIEITSSSKCYA